MKRKHWTRSAEGLGVKDTLKIRVKTNLAKGLILLYLFDYSVCFLVDEVAGAVELVGALAAVLRLLAVVLAVDVVLVAVEEEVLPLGVGRNPWRLMWMHRRQWKQATLMQ